MTNRWWLPLVLSAGFLVFLSAANVSRGRHVVHQGVVAAAVGAIVIGLLVGVPAFYGGIRYQRTHPT